MYMIHHSFTFISQIHTIFLGTIRERLIHEFGERRSRVIILWAHGQVPGYINVYVGDSTASEMVSDREGPRGIAVSMHCRIIAFLGKMDETCCVA